MQPQVSSFCICWPTLSQKRSEANLPVLLRRMKFVVHPSEFVVHLPHGESRARLMIIDPANAALREKVRCLCRVQCLLGTACCGSLQEGVPCHGGYGAPKVLTRPPASCRASPVG